MRATVSSWSCLCWSQDGGVEGYAFIFSCENYRITTCCRTTIDRRTNKCIYRTKIHSIVERAHLKSTFLKESMKRRLAQSRDRAEVHTQGLVEGMATHSSVLAWRIPWTEEPGGVESIGSQRLRHDWSDWAHIYIFTTKTKLQGIVTVMSESTLHFMPTI